MSMPCSMEGIEANGVQGSPCDEAGVEQYFLRFIFRL